MSKRAGFLGALMATLLAACTSTSSASPAPLFAPDDLASSLPASVSGMDLTIEEGMGVTTNPRRDGYYLDLAGDDRLRALLTPLERTLLDVRVAHAFAGDEGLDIVAFRVDGVAAASLLDGYVQMVRPIPSPYPADIPLAWQTIDGRRVLVFGTKEMGPGWAFFYPKGEVMFLAFDLPDGDIAEMDDVLAGLP